MVSLPLNSGKKAGSLKGNDRLTVVQSKKKQGKSWTHNVLYSL